MFETTTPKGTEGYSISYLEEERVGKEILKILPKGWKVTFRWAQILFADVQWKADKKQKVVDVVYNQNLHIWKRDLVEAIAKKINKKLPR